MAALSLGQAIARAVAPVAGAPTRSGGTPVRRDSIEAGSFEAHFFTVPAQGEPDRLLRLARTALDTGRRLKRRARLEDRRLAPAEQLLADLTAAAIRVYEELLTLARLNRGRVFPSYAHLAAATALGRATVARAIDSLERAGFLVRQRRYRRIEGEGAGPRYAQTSNAYRPTMPQRLMALLPRRFRPAPPPPDALHHAVAQAQAVAAMRASLSCRELAETTVDGPLASVLAALGAAIDRRERESQNEPETLPESIDKGVRAPCPLAGYRQGKPLISTT